MKRKLIAFSLWLLSVPISLTLPSAPSPGKVQSKNPPPPPMVTAVDCKLTLTFAGYLDRSCGAPPSPNANPTTMAGGTSLTGLLTNKYFCKITVEPNAPTTNYNASTFKFVWSKAQSFMTIKVPKECTSKITIEFYEDCNLCTGSRYGRPVFRYTNVLQKGQPYENAFLQYHMNLPC